MKHKHMFDIDGTITRIDDIVEAVKDKFPKFTLEDYTHYDIKNSLVENGFLSKGAKFNTGQFLRGYPFLFLDGKPREHIKDYLSKANEEGGSVEFVTARYFTEERYNYTLDWANKHFPDIGINKSNLHFIDANAKHHHAIKALLDAKASKTKTTVHFYEDKHDTLVNIERAFDRMNKLVNLEEFGELKLYLMDTPYNKNLNTENMTLVRNWKELM